MGEVTAGAGDIKGIKEGGEGLVKDAPDYSGLPSKILLSDLYANVAAAEKIAVPNDDMSPFEVKLDQVIFDPKKPGEEAARP